MRSLLLLIITAATLSRPARGQRSKFVPPDTATLARLLRDFRAAQVADADSLVLYRAVLAFADSLITNRRVDGTVMRVRLLALAPVITADMQRHGSVASCSTIRAWQSSLSDFYNTADFGQGCEDCARAAAQFFTAHRALDSLARVKCPEKRP